jgi:hypothetical protein
MFRLTRLSYSILAVAAVTISVACRKPPAAAAGGTAATSGQAPAGQTAPSAAPAPAPAKPMPVGLPAPVDRSTQQVYATPILYPLSVIPERYQYVLKLNPLYTQLVLFQRAAHDNHR